MNLYVMFRENPRGEFSPGRFMNRPYDKPFIRTIPVVNLCYFLCELIQRRNSPQVTAMPQIYCCIFYKNLL